MDFRWVVFITLWTFFSGPVFSAPRKPVSPSVHHAKAAPQAPR
jgi:hypothetical protein